MKDLILNDIFDDGDSRLTINASCNYHLADLIKNGDYGNIDGYINLPEQGEIMLIDKSNICCINKDIFNIRKNISYKKINENWRMINNETIVKNKVRCCCIS